MHKAEADHYAAQCRKAERLAAESEGNFDLFWADAHNAHADRIRALLKRHGWTVHHAGHAFPIPRTTPRPIRDVESVEF